MSTFSIVLDDDQGQQRRESFPTSVSTIDIGRGTKCQVIIASSGASRKHAVLTYNGGQFSLADQGTTNGTFVNNVQITAPLALAPGDVIEIGGVHLHIDTDASVWTNPRSTPWGKTSVRERKTSKRKPSPPSNKSVNLSDNGTDTFLAVRSVAADVFVDGPHASMQLVITFHNDIGRTIEGDLVFPLPPMAALRSLVAKIGQRTIHGKVRGRDRAKAEYQRAIESGRSAAIGESEGEDLARLQIAPIENGEDVEITLKIDQILLPISDGHRLIVPLTYMPRYVENSAEINATENAAVNRPRPLTLAARASVHITIDHPDGTPATIRCASHRTTTNVTEKESRIKLLDAPLDRDLQIEIADRPRGDKPALWVRHDATNGPDANGPTTTVAIVPPAFADEGPSIARNVVFLVDRSGSMNGGPMSSAIRAVRGALRSLSPEDRFNIIAFDNALEALASAPVPFDDSALTAADAFISGIHARGGTEASMAIQAALAARLDANVSVAMTQPPPPDQTYRLRVVVFMTDGDVANAGRVLRAAKEKLFDTRLHVLGIGDAVQHAMLAEIAEVGGGTYTPVATNEDLEKALVRLKNAITAPLWTGIRVVVERDGERNAPKMLEPPGPMDLFAAEPVLFSFRGPINAGDKIVLMGQKSEGDDQRMALELSIPAHARAESAATLWALLRNRRLTYRFDPADDDTLEGLGTAFGVVNRKVALVGVHSDERQATIEGHVPVVLPMPNNTQEEPLMMRSAAYSPPPGGARPAAKPAAFASAMPGYASMPGAPPPPMSPPSAPASFGGAPPGFGPPPPPAQGFGPPPPPAMAPPAPRKAVAAPAPARMVSPAPMVSAAPMREESVRSTETSTSTISFPDGDAGLRALILQQKADGLFGGDIASTLAAVAALVGRGHTAREGLFRAELRRTTMTLRSKIPSLSGNEQAMALLALALLVMPHGDPAPDGLAPDLATKLEGLSLSDLTETLARVRAAITIAPAGWDVSPLAQGIKRTFL